MFRVDTREFNPGDIITPNPVPYSQKSNFGPEKAKIEQILEEEKPASKNGSRSTCLYVFIELRDAISFATKLQNSKIYKVSLTSDSIPFHRGDMNLVDCMVFLNGHEDAQREIARKYWDFGSSTEKACLEGLCAKVIVDSILLDSESLRRDISNKIKFNSRSIESLKFYRDTIHSLFRRT